MSHRSTPKTNFFTMLRTSQCCQFVVFIFFLCAVLLIAFLELTVDVCHWMFFVFTVVQFWRDGFYSFLDRYMEARKFF